MCLKGIDIPFTAPASTFSKLLGTVFSTSCPARADKVGSLRRNFRTQPNQLASSWTSEDGVPPTVGDTRECRSTGYQTCVGQTAAISIATALFLRTFANMREIRLKGGKMWQPKFDQDREKASAAYDLGSGCQETYYPTLKFSLDANKSISGLQMVDWSSLKMVGCRDHSRSSAISLEAESASTCKSPNFSWHVPLPNLLGKCVEAQILFDPCYWYKILRWYSPI